MAGRVHYGTDFDGWITAQAPKQHGQAGGFIFQMHSRLRVCGFGRVEMTGPAVPDLADGFFRLPRFQRVRHGLAKDRRDDVAQALLHVLVI